MTDPTPALPPVVDLEAWRSELETLRGRKRAATKELDAIAAQRRRLPMVELPEIPLEGADGPVPLVDVFGGASQLIVCDHMWHAGAEWQCGGCTSFTAQFTRTDFLARCDARFVVVTQGPSTRRSPIGRKSATSWSGARPRTAPSARSWTPRRTAASP